MLCTILVLRGFGLLLSKAYASNTGSLPIGENKIGWSLKKSKTASVRKMLQHAEHPRIKVLFTEFVATT
jgi:hypothetical protein